jgi:glycosyltransferase involved in cell wall biosynthesis
MIDILIPTYNRKNDLNKNIYHLNDLIEREGLEKYFNILVSDNCSTDDSFEELQKIKSNLKVNITLFQQDENIGLEKNAIFLLEKATSDFIMYIGDDDYLPSGYLSYVVDKINEDIQVCVIIPGITAYFAGGSTKESRIEKFSEKKFEEGFLSALKTSHLGHQLSGVLFRREGLYDKYTENNNLRNIYPFIFFVAYNALRGKVYYAPKYKVLVTQSNSKDWGYDDSGLLTEIFKNYKIIYPNSVLKRFLLCQYIMIKQRWRLRIGKNPYPAMKYLLFIY